MKILAVNSKIELADERIILSVDKVNKLLINLFISLGCSKEIAFEISEHLIDSSLCGVESHGVFRALQYKKSVSYTHLTLPTTR